MGDVLNYALTLEYLEDAFYEQGLMAEGLIPENRRVIFQQISQHESAHVQFLLGVLDSMDVTPVSKPEFDFTANGMYAMVWSNYAVFLTLSQAFEDTGVRAYKGRAQELVGQSAWTAALQIHSVEARHASMIRRLRAEKGWITSAETNGVPAAIYAGEDVTMQGTVNITGLGYTTAARLHPIRCWPSLVHLSWLRSQHYSKSNYRPIILKSTHIRQRLESLGEGIDFR